MCSRVVERFNGVEYLYRDDTRPTRYIPANHENHAEFADGVRETQNHPGQKASARQGQGHRKKRVSRRGAKCARSIDRGLWDTRESRLHGLNGEWKRIDYGGHDQPGEAEGQRIAGRLHPKSTKWCVGSHQDQQVEPKNGRRQNKRQGGDRFE